MCVCVCVGPAVDMYVLALKCVLALKSVCAGPALCVCVCVCVCVCACEFMCVCVCLCLREANSGTNAYQQS